MAIKHIIFLFVDKTYNIFVCGNTSKIITAIIIYYFIIILLAPMKIRAYGLKALQ